MGSSYLLYFDKKDVLYKGGQKGPGPAIFGSMETRMLFSTTIFASVVVDGVLRLEGCRVS